MPAVTLLMNFKMPTKPENVKWNVMKHSLFIMAFEMACHTNSCGIKDFIFHNMSIIYEIMTFSKISKV